MKHVIDIRLNLLSVVKLLMNDMIVVSRGTLVNWTKGSMIVAKGSKSYTLYVTHVKIIKNVHAIELDEEVGLWNKRLCHMSEKDMVELAKRNVLFDMRNSHLKKYDHCFTKNKNRVSF